VTGAHLGPADVPPWRSVIDSETTDLHGSTCELHAVLVTTSSIRLIRASRMRIGGFWRLSQQQVADEFDRLLER